MFPYFYMSSLGPLRRQNHYSYVYNFAILNNGGYDFFNYTSDTIGKVLPPPHKVHKCTSTEHEIWLYNDNSLDTIVKRTCRDCLKRLKKEEFYFQGNSLSGNTGKSVGTSRSASALNDKPGFLILGPNMKLDKGRYEISMKYSSKGSGGYVEVIGECRKWFFVRKNIVFHKQDFPENTSKTLSMLVDIPSGGVRKFEVRVWFSGSGSLSVDSLRIMKVKK